MGNCLAILVFTEIWRNNINYNWLRLDFHNFLCFNEMLTYNKSVKYNQKLYRYLTSFYVCNKSCIKSSRLVA
jgi:hypothetical protein